MRRCVAHPSLHLSARDGEAVVAVVPRAVHGLQQSAAAALELRQFTQRTGLAVSFSLASCSSDNSGKKKRAATTQPGRSVAPTLGCWSTRPLRSTMRVSTRVRNVLIVGSVSLASSRTCPNPGKKHHEVKQESASRHIQPLAQCISVRGFPVYLSFGWAHVGLDVAGEGVRVDAGSGHHGRGGGSLVQGVLRGGESAQNSMRWAEDAERGTEVCPARRAGCAPCAAPGRWSRARGARSTSCRSSPRRGASGSAGGARAFPEGERTRARVR